MEVKIYTELIIKYKREEPPKSARFYLCKQVVQRGKYKAFHFLEKNVGKHGGLKIWFEDLQNKDDLEKFLDESQIDHEWGEYKRAHIIELAQPACKCVIEDLPCYIGEDDYQLGYFIHLIMTSMFMGWKDQKRFFEHMAKEADRNMKAWRNFNRRKKAKEKKENGTVN